MEFTYLIVIGLTMIVFGILFVHTYKRRRMAGAGAFLAQIVLIVVWSAGAMMEMLAQGVSDKLFWRNVQQIGVFSLPVNCVVFAVSYGGYARWRKWLPLFWIIPAAAVILMFTDQAHHWMRAHIEVAGIGYMLGGSLRIEYTPLGLRFIAFNFIIAAVSLFMLGSFAARVSGRMRSQVIHVMASIFVAFAATFINFVWLDTIGVRIPVIVLYLPSCALLFYSLFRHRLFMVSPIAREKVFDVIDQGIVVTDAEGMIVDRNPYALQLAEGFFAIGSELIGRKMADAFAAHPEWVRLVSGSGAGQLEVQSPLMSTGMHFLRIKVYPLQSVRGRSIGMVSLLRDITERRLQEFELRSRADRDCLTGLLNRRGFLEEFRQLLVCQAEGPVSVLMIDVDGLKPVNDTYGHFNGDRMLIALAGLLRGSLRQMDAIGRIGGDEFAAALPGTDVDAALGIAERIRKEAGALAVEMENGESVRITLSIGVSCGTGGAPDADTLLDQADKAMYRAKKRAKDSCAAFETETRGLVFR